MLGRSKLMPQSISYSYLILIVAVLVSGLPTTLASLGPIDIDAFKVVLCLGFLVWSLQQFVRQQVKLHFPKELHIFALFFCWLMITAIWSKNQLYASIYLFGLALQGLFLLLIINLTKNINNVRVWVRLLPFFGLTMAFFLLVVSGQLGGLRHTSTSYSHNSTMAGAFIPLAVYQVYAVRFFLMKLIYLVVLLFLLIIVLLTEQRAALLSLSICSFFLIGYMIFYRRPTEVRYFVPIFRRLVVAVGVVAFSLTLIIIVAYQIVGEQIIDHFIQRILYTFIQADSGVAGNAVVWHWRESLRYEIYQAALNMSCDYFPFGAGWGSFKGLYSQYGEVRSMVEIDPHSVYLRLLAETGIVGLGLFVFFIIKCWRNFAFSAKVARSHKDIRNYILIRAIQMGFLSILIMGFTREILFEPPLYIFIGMAVVLKSHYKRILNDRGLLFDQRTFHSGKYEAISNP